MGIFAKLQAGIYSKIILQVYFSHLLNLLVVVQIMFIVLFRNFSPLSIRARIKCTQTHHGAYLVSSSLRKSISVNHISGREV
jgi:hypothetical protein